MHGEAWDISHLDHKAGLAQVRLSLNLVLNLCIKVKTS